MDTTNPRALYAIEPNSERFTRWLAETTRWAVRLYWDLFVALSVTFLMMGMALICFSVGLLDLIKHPGNASADLLLMSASATFLIFERVRAFFWAFLACSTVWFLLVAAILLPILGADYRPASITAKIAIVLLDFLPPIITAVFIDYARHREP